MRKYLKYRNKVLSVTALHSLELLENDMGSNDLKLIYIITELDEHPISAMHYTWRLPDITTQERCSKFMEHLLKFLDVTCSETTFDVEQEAAKAAQEVWSALQKEEQS